MRASWRLREASNLSHTLSCGNHYEEEEVSSIMIIIMTIMIISTVIIIAIIITIVFIPFGLSTFTSWSFWKFYIRMLLCLSSTLAWQLSLPTCFLLVQFSSTVAFNSALDTRLYKTMPRHVFPVICNYFNIALCWIVFSILLLKMLSHLNDLDEFRFGQRVNWKHLSMSRVLYLNGRKIQL